MTRKLFNPNFFAPVFILAIGLAFLAFATIQILDQTRLAQNGVEAVGTVTELQARNSDDGSTYAPVVQFLTGDEQQISFVSSSSAQPPDYKVGDKVTVIYLPDRPAMAEIKDAGAPLLIIFAVLGSLLILTGLAAVFFAFRAVVSDTQ